MTIAMGDTNGSSCGAEAVRHRCVSTAIYLLLFTTLFFVLSPSPRTAAALLRRSRPTACRGGNVTEIVFLALYPPCSEEARSSSSELERLEQCDVLAEAAIDLAVERINHDPSILPEGATLRVIPVRFEEEDDANVLNMDDQMIMVSHTVMI